MEREARHRATSLVREAVQRERERRENYLREQRARIDAHVRTERFRRETRGVARSREALAGALETRWRAAAAQRQRWLAMVFEQATTFLPDGDWWVGHPSDWSTNEADEVLARLSRNRPGVTVGFEPGDQAAGILISCGKASVDARPAGLVAESARVDGLLLRALNGNVGERDR